MNTKNVQGNQGKAWDVVVIGGGAGDGGANTTANWLSGITKMLPGLHEFANMAGMQLPEILGSKLKDAGTAHTNTLVAPQSAEPTEEIGGEGLRQFGEDK